MHIYIHIYVYDYIANGEVVRKFRSFSKWGDPWKESEIPNIGKTHHFLGVITIVFRECIPPVFIDDVICTLIFFQRPSRFAIRLWSVWSRIHTKKHLTCMFTTVVALWLLVTFPWGVPLTGPKQIYV